MIQVIVADGVLLDRKQLRGMLEKIGLDVVSESRNGIQAYNEYRIYKPNIIFLALDMPMMDGISSMRRIKETYADAKVILVGDETRRRQIFDGLELGADEYIFKPYNLVQIEKVIQKTFNENSHLMSKM
jgi:two-component system chemotaxis response regulator CheY